MQQEAFHVHVQLSAPRTVARNLSGQDRVLHEGLPYYLALNFRRTRLRSSRSQVTALEGTSPLRTDLCTSDEIRRT